MATHTQLTEAQMRAVGEEMLEAWNRHDIEVILEHLREDVVWTDPTLEAPAIGKDSGQGVAHEHVHGVPGLRSADR